MRSSYAVLMRARPRGVAAPEVASVRYVKSSPTIASGMSPTVRKVERYELCILRQRVPRCSSAYWSDVGPNMQIRTSAISPRPAARTAWIRLSAASLDGRSLERCEPTMTIGTGVSCTMNERIAAVWPIVSVPWPTTMPSTPLSISSPIASGERHVLLLGHVLGEDAEELLRRQVRDVGELRHGAVQLAGREGGDDGARPVVEARGDRAAGAEERHARQVGPARELLLRDPVDRLLVADLLHRAHAVDVEADVVAGLELEDDVLVVERLAARQDDALERAAGVVRRPRRRSRRARRRPRGARGRGPCSP